MAKQKIIKIKPSTLAKFEGIFGGMMGFVISIAALFVVKDEDGVVRSFTLVILGDLFSVIATTALYFSLAWIFGYVHAVLFNSITRAKEGIEIEVIK